jgi:hypothetical protein
MARFVEHWGGREPEAPDRNLSGHTQVDGPTTVQDRDKTEANRALIQTYREIITVQQHYDRADDFLAVDYTQHAPGFGDGIERVKARYRLDVKPGTSDSRPSRARPTSNAGTPRGERASPDPCD